MRRRSASPILILLVVISFILQCQLPPNPADPSNTSVELLIRNSLWLESNLSITDTVDKPIQIGLVINLPENIDSIKVSVKAEGKALFDTLFRSFSTSNRDTIWKVMSFPDTGYKLVSVVPYSKVVNLLPISAGITIVKKTSTLQPDNHPPKWSGNMLNVALNDTTRYELNLSPLCSDPDKDVLGFSISGKALPGDTIIDSLYKFQASTATIGKNSVELIASDPSGLKDTMELVLNVTASGTDTNPPEVTMLTPDKDSSVTNSESYVVDLLCSDASGIDSVYAVFNGKTTSAVLENGHYKISITGLVAGVYNAIQLTVRDKSTTALKTTKTIKIKYAQSFTITYNGNEKSSGVIPTDTGKYETGASVIVKDNTGNFTKTGFTFAGWNTAADGSGTAHAATTTFIMPAANVVLYAQWKIRTYTLRYNGNGNNGGDVPDDAVYDSNTTVTVSGNTNSLTKTGFDFNGWNTKSDGSGVILAAASTFKIKSDTTLYAQWIVKKYNLTIETPVNGTTNLSGIVSVDSAVVKSMTATPSTGYKFKCWRIVSGTALIADTTSVTTTVTLANGNATIKAVFACLTFVKQLSMAQYSGLLIKDVIQADDESYMLAGTISGGKGIVIKLDLNGDTVWTRTFIAEDISSIKKAINGCIITGDRDSKIDVSFCQLNGNQLWIYNYSQSGYYGSVARMTSDNGYIIGGSNSSITSSILVKTDAGGIHDEWSFKYSSCILSDCVQTSDGGYMMVGTTTRGANTCIIKVNSQGLEKWRDDFDSTIQGQGRSWAFSIENTKDGDCVIGGNSGMVNYGYLLKVSQAGQVKLFKTYPNASNIVSIQPLGDGYFVAGSTTVIGSGKSDFYVAKVNSSGAVVKETAYGTSGANEECTGMNLTNDGGCIMVGGNWVIKTDENGEVK
ncbi:MAG: InlB B-repeat-containing protein [Fibrobacter sp.]|nr:InlB B-repeat-containing protein [Fibrobacter sp.]